MRRSRTPIHRNTGDKLGYAGNVVPVRVTCQACQSNHEEMIDGDVSLRVALEGMSCLFCGRAGQFKLTRKAVA